MTRIGVIGSRCYPALDEVREFVSRLPAGACVVTGGATGVDQAAEAEARHHHGLIVDVIRPVYGDRYPAHYAPLVRNQLIVDSVDGLVAFWDGHSAGTKHAIKAARRRRIPVWIWWRSSQMALEVAS